MHGQQPGDELGAVAHVNPQAGAETEMASSMTGLLTNRNHREPHGIVERGTGRKKGDYAAVHVNGPSALVETDESLNDEFYDEQLRSDGWHLDETSDDEQLDFSLPKALPSKAQSLGGSCECAPNAASLRRIRARAMQNCTVM
mmetsp:Transcript_34322/g.85531  ORF Transcript_34322/g.85531 Transcript_34322/m.85531 type:complete len:143 (-) Transcript_34322:342-770(-)